MGVLTMLVLCTLAQTPVEPAPLTVVIRGSLEQSFTRAVPAHGEALSAEVARLLRWRGDVNRQIHAGDRVVLIYSEPATGEPELLALQFMGLQLQLQAYRYTGADQIARYYDAAGALIEPEMVNTPVPATVQITETMQHGRGRRHHNGIDLKAAQGTPIRMPFAGQVRRVNWSTRANGNCIEVTYDSGLVGRFLHLYRVHPEVRVGARLPADAPLGQVGSTGHSNAAHLHYEILREGTPLEPLDVHGRRRAELLSDARSAFDRQRAHLDGLMAAAALPQPPVLTGQTCTPVSNEFLQPLGCRP